MPIRHALLATAAALALLALAPAALADTLTGTGGADRLTGRVSASTINGRGGDDVLYGDPVAGMGKPRKMQRVTPGSYPLITADGRTLFFARQPAGESLLRMYRKDLKTGKLTMISTGALGTFNSHTMPAAISPNGKYLAFRSNATNIPNGASQIGGPLQLYLKDNTTGQISPVTKVGGNGSNGDTLGAVFSNDSSLLAFTSEATNLYNDTNAASDVFIVKTSEPEIRYLASTASDGQPASGGNSYWPVFSPDSRMLAFTSDATNLVGVGNDNNVGSDVFLKSIDQLSTQNNRVIGEVSILSTDAQGVHQVFGSSRESAFSPDGREVAFISTAGGIVPGDANGSGEDVLIKTIKGGGSRPEGSVRIVSRSSAGVQGEGVFGVLVFSPDGTRLAFSTDAKNLATGSNNGHYQVLMKDITKDLGAITLISRNKSSGLQGVGLSSGLRFVQHGSKFAFISDAPNLITKDTNGSYDIFLATLAAPSGRADAISGGGGRDTIIGGPGADRLRGGKGADRFVYLTPADSRPRASRRDTILDFNANQGDVIDLTAIDANTRKRGNQAFRFVGSKPFDGKPGRLRFSGGILSADTNGDRKANFAVHVQVTGGKLTGKKIRK